MDSSYYDRRKTELYCINCKHFCQWCVIDFIIKNNIKKLTHKWKINKKNRFN